MNSFTTFPLRNGLLADFNGDAHPTRCYGWRAETLTLPADGSHFGFVHEGEARLETPDGAWVLQAGMYFAHPGSARIAGGAGLTVTRLGYRGFFQIGGPIEARGRLRYIDGCTDSLLIPPVLKGDPCLNLLHFPPGVNQTAHTHPSVRIGVVAAGGGVCRLEREDRALEPGLGFAIPAHVRHGFATGERDMIVIAYHPDSDYGPAHRDHPMINRTIVDGVSARNLAAIQTRPGDAAPRSAR